MDSIDKIIAFIALMLFVDKLKNIRFLKFLEVFKNPYSYIAALGLISFTISMVLLFISLFDIKKLCILCAFTYLLNLLIGMIAAKGIGFKEAFKQSFIDFRDALKIKPYAIAFGVVLLVAIAFLTYTKQLNIILIVRCILCVYTKLEKSKIFF